MQRIQSMKAHGNDRVKVNKIVFLLITIFSLSSWIDLVGVFSEMPLMVPMLPEGWKLSLYLSIAIEIPIIGPIVIYVLNLVKPEVVHYGFAIGVVILTGFTSLSFMAKFWNRTILIGSKRRSIPLLVLVTCLGLVDNCSSIIFYPYMKRYPNIYLSALLVGESLTGFIPAVMKIIQGGAQPYCKLNNEVIDPLQYYRKTSSSINQTILNEVYTEPRFSVSTYIAIIAAVMCICLLAFCSLELIPSFKRVQVNTSFLKQTSNEQDCLTRSNSKEEDDVNMDEEYQITPFIFFEFMCLLAILAFLLWGLLSALYTYSILPYGFNATNNAIIIANSIRFSAVILAYKKPTTNRNFLKSCMLVVILMGVYLLICAIYSPCPPLIDTLLGQIISTSCLILIDYISTYVRVSVLRLISFTKGNGLITSAMVMKVSILVGVFTGMFLIDYLNIFKTRLFCIPLNVQCDGYRSKFL